MSLTDTHSMQLRGITVCVDYSDILSVTLPYNLHHFSELWIVTTSSDTKTVDLLIEHSLKHPDIRVVETNKFFDNGAFFNKWKALEHGLSLMGKYGTMCVFDADIVFPKNPNWSPLPYRTHRSSYLFTPYRRMLDSIPSSISKIPPETDWQKLKLAPAYNEFSGYCHIFNAEDPICRLKPWYQTDWKHAGGADSIFQSRWNDIPGAKIRPPFEVLHIGQSNVNWCGRASAFVDGTYPENADERHQTLRQIMRDRSTRRGRSKDRQGPDIYRGTDYSPEKIKY